MMQGEKSEAKEKGKNVRKECMKPIKSHPFKKQNRIISRT